MAQKLRSTATTFIQTGDSTLLSLKVSRIQLNQPDSRMKGLSYSLQNIRSPFQQTLPLKFPKKRIIRGSNVHMLTETEEPVRRPCIRPSQSRNREDTQRPYRRQKGTRDHYKFNQQSEDNNIQQIVINSSSLDNSQSLSPLKRSRRLYHHLVAQQSVRDPILVGEPAGALINSSHKKFYTDDQKRKNIGEGSKASLLWTVNKSVQKEKFNNRCNAKPNQPAYVTSRVRNEQKTVQKTALKLSRVYQRPQTYTEMYASRKLCAK